MMQMDKAFVWGAWAVMAAVGSWSAWKVSQTPKVEPWVAAMERELHPTGRTMPPPPQVPVWNNPWDKLIKTPRPVAPDAAYVSPHLIAVPGPAHERMAVKVLPFPVVGEAKADLHGTTISWTLQDPPKETLESWKDQVTAKPAGFIIKRQRKGGTVETLAKVGPEARTYTDLSTEPKSTYQYWVQVTGEETVRSSYPAVMMPVTKGLETFAAAKTPTNVRVSLVGGDKTTAALRVETYDRAQKKWIPKIVMAAPGRDVGTSGWTLKGLRFDNFTLVADLTDDEGVDRVLRN